MSPPRVASIGNSARAWRRRRDGARLSRGCSLQSARSAHFFALYITPRAPSVFSPHQNILARSWRCASVHRSPTHCRGMADTASDECVDAPCAADASSNGSARGSAAFTNYYRQQLAPLLGAAASDSRGLLGQPPAFWLRPLGCGQHAVCRSCAQPRFVSQASRVRGKPSRWHCERRSLSPSGSPDGTRPRTHCATRWRQSTLPPALPRRAGRCLGTLTGWRGRPVRPDVSSLQPCGCWVAWPACNRATLRARGPHPRACHTCRPRPRQFDVSRAALKSEGGDPALRRLWAW